MPAYAEPISWAKTYGGVGVDAFQMIQQTADGGYIAAGYTETLGIGPGALLMKLDGMGAPEWQKTFSGTGNEEFSAVIETSDGGFAAAGGINAFESSTDAWVVKVDSEGSVEWEKAYGLGSQGDFASDIAATNDNGFIVTLETRQSDFPTLSLIKLP